MNWKASLTGAVIVLIAGGAVGVAIGGKTKTKTRLIAAKTTTKTVTVTTTTPGPGTGGGGTPSTPSTPTGGGPGHALNGTQLAQVVLGAPVYQSRLGQNNYPTPQQDSTSYALQGGITKLQLCSTQTIPATGWSGADSSQAYTAYSAVGVNLPSVYFGSDAASFTGQGAKQFLDRVMGSAANCGWHPVRGPKLDDQTLRLTIDQQGPDGVSLHDDVILVRDGSNVVEIGAATASGTHEADANYWAGLAAMNLAHTVSGA